jgi:hypothetical protein
MIVITHYLKLKKYKKINLLSDWDLIGLKISIINITT